MSMHQLPINTTVLVVEDHDVLRECLRELLADSYRVSDAVDAAEALECMTANGVPNVLVADMQLGSGMNGLELIAVARLRWPEVRALLITGTSVTDPVLDPGDRFLRKPFTIGALTYAVWELVTGQDKLGACRAAPNIDPASPSRLCVDGVQEKALHRGQWPAPDTDLG